MDLSEAVWLFREAIGIASLLGLRGNISVEKYNKLKAVWMDECGILAIAARRRSLSLQQHGRTEGPLDLVPISRLNSALDVLRPRRRVL